MFEKKSQESPPEKTHENTVGNRILSATEFENAHPWSKVGIRSFITDAFSGDKFGFNAAGCIVRPNRRTLALDETKVFAWMRKLDAEAAKATPDA